MTSSSTLVQLAAELTLFVVATAGAGLSLRNGLLGLDRAARVLLVAGFVVLGTTAFLVGSLLVDRADDGVALATVRVAACALVALGAVRWAGSRRGRPLLLLGLVALAGAAALDARGVDLVADGLGAEPVVLAAAVVMGSALVVAGRHTIPGRIGTSVAGVLLVVVLLVSLALSAVVSSTVEEEAIRRYGARASSEAAAATAEAEAALDAATLVAASVGAARGEELAVLAGGGADEREAAVARLRVAEAMELLVGPDGLAIGDPVVLVSPSGVPEVAVPSDLEASVRLALGGDPVVRESLDADGPRQGVAVVGGEAYALASVPVRSSAGGTNASTGAVVVARPLDETFLRRRAEAGEVVSFALVSGDAVLARSGPGVDGEAEVERGRQAVEADGPVEGAVPGGLVVARPVSAEGVPPQMALVLSTSADRVSRTREDLYRSLFAVALAAGLAGIALSIVVGERIGGAIRRLTAAAARIREGDLDTRAAVSREDELGDLSQTFDAMAGSLRELTDDLRTAAATEGRLRARLESVFDGVADAVVAADDDRRVTDLNPAAAALVGLGPDDDVRGDRLDEVLDLTGVDGHHLPLEAPQGRARLVAGTVAPRTGGAGVPVVGTVASLHDADGARAGTVVVLRDVRREQALEAAKQDFLATIGHELRTPLTPIKGYAGVMRRRPPTPEQARDFSVAITEGVERLERLVDRLMTYTAVTAGPAGTGRPGDRADVDLAAEVEEVVAGAAGRSDGRDLRVERPSGPVTVPGAAEHLRLAVEELVDNALRFSRPAAPVEVSVRVDDGPGGAPVAVVTVRDGGADDVAGLAGAVDAFSQGEPSATRRHDGLGLGLALVDRVARAHGGRLRVDDASASGTSVSILVPVATGRAAASSDRGPTPPPPGQDA